MKRQPAHEPRKPLQARGNKYERFFTMSLDLMCIIGFDSTFKDVNPAWERVLGYSLRELRGRTYRDFIHPDDLEMTEREAERAILEGGTAEFENRFRAKDGSFRWLMLAASANMEEQVIYAVARDVTDRKLAAQRLQESETRYRTLVEMSPEAIIVHRRGIVTYANPAAARLWGLDEAGGMVGLDVWKQLPDEYQQEISDRIEHAIEYGERMAQPMFLKITNARGQELFLEAVGGHYPSADGVAAQVIVRDVTEEMRQRLELVRLNRALAAINALNQTIIRAADERALLREACTILCRTGGFRMAWVGEIGTDEDRMITPITWDGYEDGYLSAIRISWGDNYLGQGPVGRAVRERRTVVMQNVEKDIPYDFIVNEAKKREYASIIGLPLLEDGEPIAVLALYSRYPDAFDREETRLLEQLAADLAYGIASLRARHERDRAEQAMRESEERYRVVVEHSPDGVIINRGLSWLYVNPAVARTMGVSSAAELIGRPVDNLVDLDPGDFEEVKRRARITMQTGKIFEPKEWRVRDAAGGIHFVESTSVRIMYEGAPALLTTVRDRTAQHQAREELRASREQLRSLAAHLQTAREDERTHIAREIHDELGQYLTGLKMDAAFLGDLVGELPDSGVKSELAQRVSSMTSLLDTTVGTIRRISTELRPSILDNLGLAAAIEWQVEEFQSRTGIRCESFVADEDVPVGRNASTTLFRILQESLTNIARHAGATRVTVSFAQEEGALVMEIRDNGCGISDSDRAKDNRFGLLGMAERAHLAGGSLAIDAAPGGGTTISVSIPPGGAV